MVGFENCREDFSRKEFLQAHYSNWIAIIQFAELAETSPTTAYRFFSSQRVQTRTARRLLDNLGIADFRTYLLML